jgi:hypothetical protein
MRASKLGAWINAVQLCGLDQDAHGGGALSTLVGVRKEPSFPTKRRAAPCNMRSAALFIRKIRPFLRNRVKAFQRFSM